MNFPNHLQYSKSHEWVLFEEDGTAVIGLTDYAQKELGDLVFVNLPEVGDSLTVGEAFADVESVKAVSDVISPVTGEIAEVGGEVLEINEELLDAPERINQDPYGAWFVKVGQPEQAEPLLSAAAYETFLAEEGNK